MGALRFSRNYWIDKFMSYVASVLYSLALNGQLSESFSPSRGVALGRSFISLSIYALCTWIV